MIHKRKIAAVLSVLTIVSTSIVPTATASEDELLTLYIGSYAAYRGGEPEYIDADNVDVTPVIKDDRTLVPVRYIGEAFSCDVSWDSATQTAEIENGSDKIEISIGSGYISVNGEQSALDVPAQIIEDRTMVPLRALAEALGKSVDYYNGLIMIGSDNEIQSLKSGDLDAYINENFKSNMALNKNLKVSEPIYWFRRICEYGDKVYTTRYAGTNGGMHFVDGNVSVSELPIENYVSESTYGIYSFTIYNDKVYYIAGNAGSDYLPASIYSCDIDGGNIQCIVDDTRNVQSCCIVNNTLYYTTFDMDWDSYEYLPNSINKVDLSTLEKTALIQYDSAVVDLYNCFDDILLYTYTDDRFNYNRSISYRWFDLTDGSSGIYNSEYTGFNNSENNVFFLCDGNDITVLYAYSGERYTLVSSDDYIWILNITDKYVYYGKTIQIGTGLFSYYCAVYRVERPDV